MSHCYFLFSLCHTLNRRWVLRQQWPQAPLLELVKMPAQPWSLLTRASKVCCDVMFMLVRVYGTSWICQSIVRGIETAFLSYRLYSVFSCWYCIVVIIIRFEHNWVECAIGAAYWYYMPYRHLCTFRTEKAVAPRHRHWTMKTATRSTVRHVEARAICSKY